jgi:hypothetical protein
MKKWLFTVLLVTSVQLLHADDVLKNSDFTDGALNWHGDGKSPADLKPADDLDANAPNYGDKGLIIVLKPHSWTKIVQEFKTPSAGLSLNVSYKLAPGTVFSNKDDDYVNVPEKIEFNGWRPFNGKIGSFMIMLSDFAKERIFFTSIAPVAGSTDQPPVTGSYDSLIPEDEKTLCLTFPPGTGAVILLHVSLDAK